ncbi:hypothetical protein V6N13_043491 [Hibiscus sabdariffa]|uniref:Uncharacterized protein n=1 Tax=Hibiscus sabdariffa TaxID=183260 RepID=A0ABR2G1I0_9ROSI
MEARCQGPVRSRFWCLHFRQAKGDSFTSTNEIGGADKPYGQGVSVFINYVFQPGRGSESNGEWQRQENGWLHHKSYFFGKKRNLFAQKRYPLKPISKAKSPIVSSPQLEKTYPIRMPSSRIAISYQLSNWGDIVKIEKDTINRIRLDQARVLVGVSDISDVSYCVPIKLNDRRFIVRLWTSEYEDNWCWIGPSKQGFLDILKVEDEHCPFGYLASEVNERKDGVSPKR